MNKICTTVKQSRKLMKLGIDVNTADMWWAEYIITEEPYYYLSLIKSSDINYSQNTIKDIPAWSLSALLELIPPYLGKFNEGIDFGLSKAMNGKRYSAHYMQLNDDGLYNPIKILTGNTAVDAAFEIVCWLLENKKI